MNPTITIQGDLMRGGTEPSVLEDWATKCGIGARKLATLAKRIGVEGHACPIHSGIWLSYGEEYYDLACLFDAVVSKVESLTKSEFVQ